MIKRMAFSVVNSGAVSGLLSVLEQADSGGEHLLRVLTYHRVDERDAQPQLSPAILSATPADFDAQMQVVARDYDPVSMSDVFDYIDNGKRLPKKSVLVTFDDGYRDFAAAWQTMQKYSVPVVLFIPTAYPDNKDRGLWWDRVYHAIYTTQKDGIMQPELPLPLRTMDQPQAGI